jgi:hypothetical protein
MAIKTIYLGNSQRTVKLGRTRPVARCPRLSLRNYLMRSLPAPPPSVDYSQAAQNVLSNIYLNDQLGDCVIAGIAHVVGVLTGNSGAGAFQYTNDQIISLYSAIGGYVPGDSTTDRGCDEQTALNYWQNTGAPAGSHQIAGWLAVNPADPTEYRTALWLFENLYFGLELPDAWLNPSPPSTSGFVWDVAGPSDPNNGHCVAGVGYTPQGIAIDSWGLLGVMTDAAIAQYCTATWGGELYTVLSQDSINQATQKAPAGFDWSQLIADFDSMGGSVQPPPAPQQPVPSPAAIARVGSPSSVEMAIIQAEFRYLVSSRGKGFVPYLQSSIPGFPQLSFAQKAELSAYLNSLN